jgi:hypothetical protein
MTAYLPAESKHHQGASDRRGLFLAALLGGYTRYKSLLGRSPGLLWAGDPARRPQPERPSQTGQVGELNKLLTVDPKSYWVPLPNQWASRGGAAKGFVRRFFTDDGFRASGCDATNAFNETFGTNYAHRSP